eukprot:1709063-Prymnesium_polylepis.1
MVGQDSTGQLQLVHPKPVSVSVILVHHDLHHQVDGVHPQVVDLLCRPVVGVDGHKACRWRLVCCLWPRSPHWAGIATQRCETPDVRRKILPWLCAV